jgi:hypothetical protein
LTVSTPHQAFEHLNDTVCGNARSFLTTNFIDGLQNSRFEAYGDESYFSSVVLELGRLHAESRHFVHADEDPADDALQDPYYVWIQHHACSGCGTDVTMRGCKQLSERHTLKDFMDCAFPVEHKKKRRVHTGRTQ